MSLKPAATDPNYKAEMKRWEAARKRHEEDPYTWDSSGFNHGRPLGTPDLADRPKGWKPNKGDGLKPVPMGRDEKIARRARALIQQDGLASDSAYIKATQEVMAEEVGLRQGTGK